MYKICISYIYVYIKVLFGPVKPELGVIPSGQENHSKTEYLNTPKCFDGRCNLSLEEKIQIMTYSKPEKLLNKRCELIARCRHKIKFKL